MTLFFFLVQVFVISFSGAMSPGPVTATVLVLGGKNRFAGFLLAVGHGIIEFPLIFLIALGVDRILKSLGIQIVIGAIGGLLLLCMAVFMLRGLLMGFNVHQDRYFSSPIRAGIILSASNPYFLLWWATIGLALATTAKEFGAWAFILFAVVHWLCDCLWLTSLSFAAFKGSALLGFKGQKIILAICSTAMFLFGLKFVCDSFIKFLNIQF